MAVCIKMTANASRLLRSRPTPQIRSFASFWRPMLHPKASTFRITAGNSFTTKFPGIRTGWSNATAGVDRFGQQGNKDNEVHIFHFSLVPVSMRLCRASCPENFEGDSSSSFFERFWALKVEAIREDLGKVGPVIADQVEEAMLGRRRTLDTSRAERESEPVRALLKFERKLREAFPAQEKLADQLHDTERELRLSPANIQNVVETGLALAGQPALRPAAIPQAFTLPALTGSWASCADGLPHPHSKEDTPHRFRPQ